MFQDILKQTFFHNRILDYITFSTFPIDIIILQIFKRILLNHLTVWAE